MTFWIGVLAVVLGLMISIALHEIGHMVPAKRFGVRVPQYFVGFGPTIWSFRRGETEYGIKALPLGGFVRLVGMFPPRQSEASDEAVAEERLRRRGLRGWFQSVAEDARLVSAEDVRPGEEHRAFYALSVPKKLAVMFGGPFVNLIISIVLFTILLSGIGVAVNTNSVQQVVGCASGVGAAECTETDEPSPAVLAGFESGDVILSWDGQAVSDWVGVATAIRDGGFDPVPVVVQRGEEEITLTVTPVPVERQTFDDDGRLVVEDGQPVTATVAYVGIAPGTERERQSIGAVADLTWLQFTGVVQVVVTLPQRLASIASSVIGDSERDPSIIGVVGIGRVAGELTEINADRGFVAQISGILTVLAALNMALFVFNMIPLPPLDGGHIAGALYEGARRRIGSWRAAQAAGGKRRFADTAKLMPVTYGMVMLMLGMFVLLLIADITNPVSLL